VSETDLPDNAEILLYGSEDGTVKVDVLYRDESFWLTQKRMAELFGVQRSAISKHLKNIFKTEELEEDSVCSILEHTAADGYRLNCRQNVVGWAKRGVPNKTHFNATGKPCDTAEPTNRAAAISSPSLLTSANPCCPSRKTSTAYESPSNGRWKNTPSPSTPSSSSPTTCIRYGPCRKMIPVTRAAGAESNAILASVASGIALCNPSHATTSVRNRYGNGASGNTPSVMETIGKGT